MKEKEKIPSFAYHSQPLRLIINLILIYKNNNLDIKRYDLLAKMLRIYEWTRFWCPSDKKPTISPEGYLINPEYEFSPNSHLIINPIKLKENCIILLGEPGIGKSVTLEQFSRDFDNEEGKILKVNLSGIGNAIHFKDEIFNHTKFQDWRTGDYSLYLLLDSFDECFLREGVIANLLVENLKDTPKERLFLRIACRTGYWPNSLNNNLKNIFRKNNVLHFTLVPLRKIDIEKVANYEVERTENTSVLDFMEKIVTMGAGVFASIPITLNALIHQYNQKGYLSKSKTDLYQLLCQFLCGEANETRRDERLALMFTPEQKYIVASRIAALCAFSGKYSIWTSTQIEGMTDDLINESILRQGQEIASGQSFNVTDICIKETLACGLFKSTKPVRQWAHLTFLEFLAAVYVRKKDIPIVQILSIIKNSYDGKIIPQLRGVVAWLCSFSQDLYDRIIETEPEVLLQLDLKLFSNDKREEIVNRLLQNYENSSLRIRFFGLTVQYKNLNHPNLSPQIQQYITDVKNPRDTKLFAIKIAEECNQSSLIQFFITLALNKDEDNEIRKSAAYALEAFSNTQKIEEIERLKPLALSDEYSETRYDLKGISLIILWPNFINFNELIEHLPDAPFGYVGAYIRFLSHHLIEKLPKAEIVSALKWITRDPKIFNPSAKPYFDRILEKILLKSLNAIESVGIIEEMSKTLSVLITDGSYLRERWKETQFKLRLKEDQELRRSILKQVLINLPFEKNLLTPLFSHLYPFYGQSNLFELIQQVDLNWLIKEVENTDNDEIKEKLAFLVYRMLSMEPDRYNIAYKLKDIPVFIQYFIPWFGPIDYESKLATKMREQFKIDQLQNDQLEELKRSREPDPLDSPLQERMKNHLIRIEHGELISWVELNWEMISENRRPNNESIFNPNIMSLPGWSLSSAEMRDRIILGAKNYIINGETDDQEWIGTNLISFPAYAGYRALRLILETDLEWLRNLTSEVWQKWISIILLYEFGIYGQNLIEPGEWFLNRNANTRPLNQEIIFRGMLLHKGYPHAKDQLITTLIKQIDYTNEQQHSLNLLTKIETLYDEFIGKALQEKLKEGNLEPDIVGKILEFLLIHNCDETKNYAKNLLKNHSSQNRNEKLISIQAAKCLLIFVPQNSWELVQKIIQEDGEWGKEIIKNVANEERFNERMLEKYNEDQLAQLYIWVYGQYPKSSDKDLSGGPKFLQSDDFIGFWREKIIDCLETRGTSDSVKALHKISIQIPQIRDSIVFRIIKAKEITRMESWKPPKPQEIYDLFQNSNSRLIQSGEHLLIVIIESLERLENKLQGRYGYSPAAIDLWDHKGKRKFRPKHEENISDYIKNHFIDDIRRVVIHREVEIDPSSSPDLFITNVKRPESSSENDTISVVIEVKGSWHPKLTSAMQDQLLEQYMIPRSLQYGLYLVGWFRSQYWDDVDYKKKTNVDKFDSLNDLKKNLDDQAKLLSKERFVVKCKVLDISLNEIHLNRY